MRKLALTVGALMVTAMLAGLVPGLDPLDPKDSMKDSDGDRLSNLLEFIYGTDPNCRDTDNGGADDGWEVYYDLNRAHWPVGSRCHQLYARYDSDGDGFPDVNVDPNYRFDPTNLWDEADLADQDGWSNLREYFEGTDPTNPDTDSDGRMDDVDPQPLIPNDEWGPGGGGNIGQNSGQGQGLGQGMGQGMGQGYGQGMGQGQGNGQSQIPGSGNPGVSGPGQGSGNGQNQPGPLPYHGQGTHYGEGWGNGQNIGPGPGFTPPSRIRVIYAEAGRFLNPDGSSATGSASWVKGKPFTVRGLVEVYNEGLDSWVPIDQAMDVVIQLNQTGASYTLWEGKAGDRGNGAFEATCVIPGNAAGGAGVIAIHALGNSAAGESWLVEG
ncbi:MAG: hypothetical protein QW379_00920 [Thermoplasmata archaeon]